MKGKTGEEEEDSFFRRHELLISSAVLLALCVILIIFLQKTSEETFLQCGDKTSYDSCSSVKPYYCQNGFLAEKSSICGCPQGWQEKNGTDTCISYLQAGQKNMTLYYTFDRANGSMIYPVYAGMEDYISKIPRSIFYKSGEVPSSLNFTLKEINDEQQRQFLLPLVIQIENLASKKDDQARIAVSLVQNIPYASSNKTSNLFGVAINYSRYPYEVLYDGQGICGEKSELLAFMLKEMGYGVVIFYFPQENHEAVGIKCPMQYSYNGTGYCFVETTGPSIISDSDLQYIGGIRLGSQPEIIPISSGISLGSNMPEYNDAKTLDAIKDGKFMLFSSARFESLKEKYGLIEEYQIA